MPVVPTGRQAMTARRGSVQTYARIAGVLILLSVAGGFFGEMYVPSRLMASTDAAATAKHIVASGSLLRMGFAGYLVEAICDIALAWIFYVLLRPVGKDLALLAAFFPVGAAAMLLLFVGIHNAWDAVIYHLLVRKHEHPVERIPTE